MTKLANVYADISIEVAENGYIVQCIPLDADENTPFDVFVFPTPAALFAWMADHMQTPPSNRH
jgi:hypothetical protein